MAVTIVINIASWRGSGGFRLGRLGCVGSLLRLLLILQARQVILVGGRCVGS